MDELLPKATGKEARFEKKKIDREKKRVREGSPGELSHTHTRTHTTHTTHMHTHTHTTHTLHTTHTHTTHTHPWKESILKVHNRKVVHLNIHLCYLLQKCQTHF